MEPLIKLCGNQREADVEKGAFSPATHLGFIFVKSAGRYVLPEKAGSWIKRIRPAQKLVGVFVNPTVDEIDEVLRFVPLDVIQLHGNETVSELLKIKETFPMPVWKAIPHQKDGLATMKLFSGVAEGFVVDSKVKGAHGGTGVSFDWEAIPAYQQEANSQNVPCLMAGGITPENIKELMTYSPEGVDISSGIETDGRKDFHKIQVITKEVTGHAYKFAKS
ncbi:MULTISPECIES: phosphoribosylanthranilate isomerase [Salimicrobium]|uniref:N-(5'-phosphoribosyl)anthranilate isomerase n=1 Tax=Salimicrobium humidisoli TaxID=2029857 RepID=A0ABX4HQH4_9BACI|nr:MULTISPECIES: phosphoribosylanthranilate isomerase [Salimicrobium]PBB04960.1 phosphoribosylanthranilate isomerase [Salimicrobium humidisoli]